MRACGPTRAVASPSRTGDSPLSSCHTPAISRWSRAVDATSLLSTARSTTTSGFESDWVSPIGGDFPDTETLLATIAAWGVEEALRQAVGMFAFALWDKQLRCLWLARDRMGEKPLYYGFQRGTLLFGSELKALRAHPDFRGDIDRNALTSYLRRGYVPSPCRSTREYASCLQAAISRFRLVSAKQPSLSR